MVSVLTGTNSFLLREHLRGLISKFVAQNGDIALERIDGQEAEIGRIIDALQSLPLLASKKMVVLTSPGSQKAFTEQIDKLLQSVPDTTDVVIVEPKLDKRLGYYKTLKSKTEFLEFNELDSNALGNWLVQAAKSRGGSISQADARYLVERLGANQQLLSNELDKLLAYDPDITRLSIDLLTEAAPQSTVFELMDAAFAGNSKQVAKLYKEQRALKVEPQQIIGLIAWQLHVLALVKTAGEHNPDQIARDAKLNPYVVRKTMGIARRVSLAEVKKLIRGALALDIRLKRENVDADEALQHYLLNITS